MGCDTSKLSALDAFQGSGGDKTRKGLTAVDRLLIDTEGQEDRIDADNAERDEIKVSAHARPIATPSTQTNFTILSKVAGPQPKRFLAEKNFGPAVLPYSRSR